MNWPADGPVPVVTGSFEVLKINILKWLTDLFLCIFIYFTFLKRLVNTIDSSSVSDGRNVCMNSLSGCRNANLTEMIFLGFKTTLNFVILEFLKCTSEALWQLHWLEQGAVSSLDTQEQLDGVEGNRAKNAVLLMWSQGSCGTLPVWNTAMWRQKQEEWSGRRIAVWM